ncbi:PTS sugar transporter subunit IIB, partial [Streptococcus pneumoniae]|uniref:PTS sugar transporter subunit IIB n=1 Tax=Streptococcus pneumoniae TaxID=1313 RepID=UPI0035B7821A
VKDALTLVDGGVPIKEINIGIIHNAPVKEQVTRSIFLGEEDKAALKELSKTHQVTYNTKPTPTGNDGAVQVTIMDY